MKILIISDNTVANKNILNLIVTSNIKFKEINFVTNIKNIDTSGFFNYQSIENKSIYDMDIVIIFKQKYNITTIVDSLKKSNIYVITSASDYNNQMKPTIASLNFKTKDKIYLYPNNLITQSILSIFPIHQKYHINSIIYNTYQENTQYKNYNLTIGNHEKYDYTECELSLITQSKNLLNKNIDIIANCVEINSVHGTLINTIIKFDYKIYCDKILTLLMRNTNYLDNITNQTFENNTTYTTRLKLIDDYTVSYYTYTVNTTYYESTNVFEILSKIVNL